MLGGLTASFGCMFFCTRLPAWPLAAAPATVASVLPVPPPTALPSRPPARPTDHGAGDAVLVFRGCLGRTRASSQCSRSVTTVSVISFTATTSANLGFVSVLYFRDRARPEHHHRDTPTAMPLDHQFVHGLDCWTPEFRWMPMAAKPHLPKSRATSHCRVANPKVIGKPARQTIGGCGLWSRPLRLPREQTAKSQGETAMKLRKSAAAIVALGVVAGAAQASLVKLGDGTVEDTATNLIWLYDWDTIGSNRWTAQKAWAENLNFAGSDAWKLPELDQYQALWADAGGTIAGLEANFSAQHGYPGYWSNTDYTPAGAGRHWYFGFSSVAAPFVGEAAEDIPFDAVAVRAADVTAAVPEPQSLALVLLALGAGAAVRRSRFGGQR